MRWTLCLVVLLTAMPAAAHPVSPNAPYVVHVEDEYGRTLRTFHRGGDTYVLGSYGRRYNIRVRNQTGRRVEAVITVDGRDVISGREGDYVGERGYILPPYGDVLVEGFRTSEATVAAFRFTDPGNSYSSRMGTPQHVGVIGVALFEERVRHWPQPRIQSRAERRGGGHTADKRSRMDADAPASAPAEAEESRSGSMADRGVGQARSARPAPAPRRNNLGTEYGETTESYVQTTHFVRQNSRHPSRVIVLRYDNEEGLEARGIRVHPREPRVYAEPSAFPRNRFAPPPP